MNSGISTGGLYNDDFYAGQTAGSYSSAREVAKIFASYWFPKSVIDVGCGRGTWLKAFHELGSIELVGVDGFWNNQEQMIDSKIAFHSCDLEKPDTLETTKKFDLAISLEVAEHLSPAISTRFVAKLCQLSDAVLFGAAIPGQGGTNHVNEQFGSYWGKIFEANNFLPFDIIRNAVWTHPQVAFWYQQNTFLYLKRNCEVFRLFESQGVKPIVNLSNLDFVHPFLYQRVLTQLEEANQQLLRSTPVRNVMRKILQGVIG